MDSYLFRKDDRSDPKWAHELAKETWCNPTICLFFPHVLSPSLSDEEVKKGRQLFEEAFESMLSGLTMSQELESAGEWREYFASGCEEESVAPPVRLHVRIPKKKNSEKLPVLLYFFAAGIGGKPDYFNAEIAQYSKDLNCIVVAPQYRPYPENKQPKQLNDIHASYQWIQKNADEIGADSERIVLMGFSLGGQLALNLAFRLKRYGIVPRGIVALFPPCDDRGNGASSRITFGGRNLGCDEVLMAWQSLFSMDMVALSCLSPEFVPGHATIDDLKGLPPIFMHVAESDPNRDNAIDFSKSVYEAGVMCGLHIWPGTCHSTFYTGGPDEYKSRYFEEVTRNIEDLMKYDMRRLWNK